MALVHCEGGCVILVDCNITDQNRTDVINHLKRIMPKDTIDVFVNSHRDCDHLSGIKEVHALYPIQQIWDSGETGTSPDEQEYKDYMELRRSIKCTTPKIQNSWTAGQEGSKTQILCLNGCRDDCSDPNSQSIVLRFDYNGSSIILPGDSDAVAWKNEIIPTFTSAQIASNILLASHHGSISFFDDPTDQYLYTKHLQVISPQMTVISVGSNPHGHPDDKAVKLYEKYSRGSGSGQKVWRTDQQGHMLLELKGSGNWSLTPNYQPASAIKV